MEHYQSSAPTDPKATAELEAARQRVGDGKQLKPEHFSLLSVAERTALYHADRARYEALRDGIEPDAPWTPTARPTTTGANL